VTRVGALTTVARTAPRGATVDEVGVVTPDTLGWHLDWRVGADDRWRMPRRETTVRQSLVDSAPVVRTAMRVPGGDAVSDVYGLPDTGGLVVVEVANQSPAPIVVAFVVRGARAVSVDDRTVVVDRRPGLLLPRAPSRWAVTRGGTTDIEVCSGAAREGAFPPTRDRGGRVEAAFLVPVPHRAAVRVAVAGPEPARALDLRTLPSAEDAARGWAAQLARGTRVDLPDERLDASIAGARAQLLLAAQARRPSGVVVAALEDWGFDDECDRAWQRAGSRERREAARRPMRPPLVAELGTLLGRAHTPWGMSSVAAELLLCLRAMLLWEAPDGDLCVLPELPDAWRGWEIDVHEAPTRSGPVSYALRWHGARAALIWSAPPGIRVRAPGLDADWSSEAGEGEALLAGSAA
jgi:hypothetical protein